MIIQSPSQIRSQPLFFHCSPFCSLNNVYIKLEGLNCAGSIKLKTALGMLDALEAQEKIVRGKHHIIESSSGNLGIALSIICKERKYRFTCITDPNTSPVSEKYIRLYGGNVIRVDQKDPQGGYLGTRIKCVQSLLANDSQAVWTNQYANPNNPLIHYNETAKEICNAFDRVDHLFIGAGTTGTLMGCLNYFKAFSPNTKIYAVDAQGSVTFGHPPKPRFIPGIGTSRKPEICKREKVNRVLLIEEQDTIKMCHTLLNDYGLFVGGSTGSVLHAVKELAHEFHPDNHIVALSPDFGEKYLDTIFNSEWLDQIFKNEELAHLANTT